MTRKMPKLLLIYSSSHLKKITFQSLQMQLDFKAHIKIMIQSGMFLYRTLYEFLPKLE